MEENDYEIHALHGFLGHPDDWLCLERKVHAYHLLNDFPIVSFEKWAENFNNQIKNNIGSKGNILIGYSLGGRLGLHALLQNPSIWKGAIFVSTHPGLKDQEVKQKRVAMDIATAEKFISEPWDALMKMWNQQDIFKHSVEIYRSEVDNNRQALAAALKFWSLGNQEDLRAHIASLTIPICWIVGEKDEKFVNLTNELHFKHSKSKNYTIPHAGHRLLFDQPKKFKLIVSQFIQNLE